MPIEALWHIGLDLVEKGAELLGAMAGIAFADDRASGDIEGCKQRRRPVAFVIVAAPRRLARKHRQHRLAAVERLDLRFFVHAQHDGMLGRRHVEAHHVAHLFHKQGVSGKLEGLKPVRLKSESAPDALHAGLRQPARLGHAA